MDAAFGDLIAHLLGGPVASSRPVHGGDVAESYRVELGDGTIVFAKTHREPPPLAFSTEAAGLGWLRGSGAVHVPAVLAVADPGAHGPGSPGVLALEWVDEGRPHPDTEERLGRELAALHRSGAPAFGRVDGRTTGSRRLPNGPCPDWPTFLARRRLEPLADLAATTGSLPSDVVARLRRLADRIAAGEESLTGPPEPPSRLHGDLWAGSRLVDAHGLSWLIDPACIGGHREFDLAMMRLFGGFGAPCFAAYQEVAPLADGWERRVPVLQLVPLVVHAVKFGGGYVGAVDEALARADA